MNVAVLTLTRDRLDYTKHCFATLRDNAGCEFDHYVLDQDSADDTRDWLFKQPGMCWSFSEENLGICRGLNRMLDEMVHPKNYDVIVRFDNDCEVIQPDTLRTVCEVAYEYDAIVAPNVAKLKNPPRVIGQVRAGDHVIDETTILGGIFMAIPAHVFTDEGFRYDESMPPYAGDEAIVPWWRAQGGTAGYLRGWTVNHYERVEEQADVFPEYQARKDAEMGLVPA